jgi:hypothetical protein
LKYEDIEVEILVVQCAHGVYYDHESYLMQSLINSTFSLHASLYSFQFQTINGVPYDNKVRKKISNYEKGVGLLLPP